MVCAAQESEAAAGQSLEGDAAARRGRALRRAAG